MDDEKDALEAGILLVFFFPEISRFSPGSFGCKEIPSESPRVGVVDKFVDKLVVNCYGSRMMSDAGHLPGRL